MTMRSRLSNLFALLIVGASAVAAHASSTPGSYTNYQWPVGTVLQSVDFRITVTADPGHSARVFWSNQFDFTGAAGAYTGMQSNGGEPRQFLFSVWDATEAKAGSPGSRCVKFDGEGEGRSCRMTYDWKEGHIMRFHVASEGDRWFGVTVTDETANVTFKLGSIRTGSESISIKGMQTWTEYFEWNNEEATCFNQPYSRATITIPVGNGGAVKPTIRSTNPSKTCSEYSRITTTGEGTVQENALGNSYRGPVTGAGGLCLDAKGEPKNDAVAILNTCSGAEDQAWVLGADHGLKLSNNLCLEGAGTANSTVKVTTCKQDPAQRWDYEKGHLRRQTTTLCLTLHGDDKQLSMAPCSENASQQWKIVEPTHN